MMDRIGLEEEKVIEKKANGAMGSEVLWPVNCRFFPLVPLIRPFWSRMRQPGRQKAENGARGMH